MGFVMDDKKKKVGIGIGGGSLIAVLYSLDPAKFMEFVSDSIAHEYVRMTLLFVVAAFFHRQGMKKDNGKLTDAINNLGDALRDDLRTLGGEIVTVKESVSKINTRVEALEKLKE